MNRGDVVIVQWPYSDLSGRKDRPAVVVQADYLNSVLDDSILIKITGKRFGVPNTEVELDPVVELDSGLNKMCYASCKDFLTRDQAIIGEVIGTLSAESMAKIDAFLKAVLDLA